MDNLAGLDVELFAADLLDRRAVRRAMKDVERVFHVAGTNSPRAGADALVPHATSTARDVVMSEALRAGVQRVVHTSSLSAIGPAPRGSTADEAQVFRAGRARPAVRQQQARGGERLRCAMPRRDFRS